MIRRLLRLAGFLLVSFLLAHADGATFIVAQSHPQAKDDNPGTPEQPLKTIAKAAGLVQMSSSSVSRGAFTSDHAAMWETSLLWHLEPGLVDLTLLDRDPNVKPYNVYGRDPRAEASPRLGAKAAEVIARDMADLASRLLRDLEPHS